uniref:Uncharacterized protein n=1 Tax=Eutreptiella gymnastica TaxID=73025 RepID=A0A7S4GIX9_9EUGL
MSVPWTRAYIRHRAEGGQLEKRIRVHRGTVQGQDEATAARHTTGVQPGWDTKQESSAKSGPTSSSPVQSSQQSSPVIMGSKGQRHGRIMKDNGSRFVWIGYHRAVKA